MNSPPNDRRNFVHKRIGRAARSFVTSGFNPVSAAGGFLAPQPSTRSSRARAKSAPNIPCRPGESLSDCVARRRRVGSGLSPMRSLGSSASVSLCRPGEGLPACIARRAREALGFTGSDPGDCGFGKVWDEVKGQCVFGLGEQAGRDDTPIGDVVMGRYGAGEMPGNMVVNRAICRPGMVVGDDGICYNKSQIRNSQREWPRGRRPLLTGGDMRAISVASRAGKRLERTTKRLQKIGLMKKAAPRRISAAAVHHAK